MRNIILLITMILIKNNFSKFDFKVEGKKGSAFQRFNLIQRPAQFLVVEC